MTDAERTYAINSAIEARKACEEQSIIEKDKVKLTKDDVKKIIEFFGGQLLESENNLEYLIKTEEEGFTIYYIDKDSEKTKATSILAILNGFGKSFFQLESMNIDDIRVYSEDGLATTEDEKFSDSQIAEYFALEFMMPQDLFEQVSSQHVKDDVVNCKEVANEFGVDCIYVIKKGSELDVFNPGPSYVKKYN